MQRIYKWRLEGARQSLYVPKGTEILHVAMQPDQDQHYYYPTMWGLCDDTAEMVEKIVLIIGTGHQIPENARYLGTCVGNVYVWHIYEEIR